MVTQEEAYSIATEKVKQVFSPPHLPERRAMKAERVCFIAGSLRGEYFRFIWFTVRYAFLAYVNTQTGECCLCDKIVTVLD